MHTPLLLGIFVVCTAASIGMAILFLRAWVQRRDDREYLYFGISTLAFSGFPGLEVLIYWGAVDPTVTPDLESVLDWITVAAAIAIPSLLHFALRFAGARREWTIMVPVYGFYLVFVALGATGQFWSHFPYSYAMRSVWGLEHHNVAALVLSPWGKIFYGTFPIALVAVTALLGRATFTGRREGLGAFGGSIVLMASMLHDAAIGVGLIESIPLLAAGIFVMAYGVSLTLVARHDTLSATLQRRTSQLSRRSEELKRSYEALKRTQRRLVESEQLAMLGELAAVIAHEVRNPSAIIRNVLTTLRKSPTEGPDRDILLSILGEETGRLEQLSNRLRDYSRPLVLQASQINLQALLDRSLALVGDRPGVALAVQVPADLPMVQGDPGLLRQAFDNLVTNAVQAMDDQGKLAVQVELRRVDGIETVAVDFQDDGEGMTQSARDQALSPFYTTRPTGTGLGLPIVSRIVEAHGGRLAIHSTPAGGTTVSLLLPRKPDDPIPVPPHRHRRISLLP
jgi:signal transduction histidine kinase